MFLKIKVMRWEILLQFKYPDFVLNWKVILKQSTHIPPQVNKIKLFAIWYLMGKILDVKHFRFCHQVTGSVLHISSILDIK